MGAWAAWVEELRSIAAAGLAYSDSPYDRDRYTRLLTVSADMTAALRDAEPEVVRMLFRAEDGYATPKLDVRAAVFDDAGRVLLVRERVDGAWALPGGWADVGESLAEGVAREVREESGYEVVVDRLLGLYERERWGHPPLPFFTLKAVLAARVVGGAPATSSETDEVGWFARDRLPPLSVGRNSPQLLARVFAHADDPSLPPDVD
jgi:ADP-ribose pyrophosphatase YjhB (NUDIX family)